ncbi:hypothetical protein EV175_004461 [Coemansia sp. RSA 1933]|nr:hypothetical protein EV175_004461 [Coemansia sp. RSA 1933]
MGERVHRPTYLGIHTRDATTQILYISSGCRQSLGYPPEYVVTKTAQDFIADPYKDNYSSIYSSSEEEQAADDEANAYVMYGNVNTASGIPVLHRITSFKCDNCVIFIGMGFPEIPYQSKNALEVQMLDGAMKRVDVTRDRNFVQGSADNHQQAAERWRERADSVYGQRVPLYYAPSRQIKVAFVLENQAASETQASEGSRRQNGPLVVFVTGSVGRLIDADTADIMRFPFLKLVAPEDLVRVSKFFEKLGDSTDVLFETFALLQKPPVVEGDIAVADGQNTRIVVECLGANVQDGMALLLRKLRSEAPPTMDDMGNYLRPKVNEIDEESGYRTLSEIISDDPETSDAGEWSRLL